MKVVVNTNKVREINNELVREALKSSEYSTKNSVSKETGLSISTCRNILEEMLKTGEVKEVSISKLTGGRPSRHFVYNKNFAYVGIIYLRIEGPVSYIYSSVINMLGETIYENNEELIDIKYDDIDKTVLCMIKNYSKLEVLCIGIPGVVIDGYIGLGDVDALRNFNLKDKLENKYQLKVIMENDVNAAAIGYYNRNSRKTESIVYLYYPDEGCPGGGIIINGKVLRGHTNFAGEVSYLPLGPEYEEHGLIQSDSNKFFSILVKTILILNSVINPETIILSWKQMKEDYFDVITDTVNELSQVGHSPNLVFNSDYHNDYVNGLTFLALKEMSCNWEVIERC